MTPDDLYFISTTRDLLFITAMMAIGWWLESIGGKRGWADLFWTPWPLGFSGVGIVLLEHFA